MTRTARVGGGGQAPDYDFVAGAFAPLERLCFLGGMERARAAHRSELRGVRRVLCLGPGDGRALVALRRVCPDARLIAVEPSARMRALAETRLGESAVGALDWVSEPWPEGAEEVEEVDAIVSDFFLDQFVGAELERVVAAAAGRLAPSGKWCWADFAPPESRLQRAWIGPLLSALYTAFGLTTGLGTRRLEDPGPALARAGLEPSCAWRSPTGLFRSEVWISSDRT